MSDINISPYMMLPVPIVGQELGPQYATDVNDCLNLVDSHDHSTGQGLKISPNGININSDLNANGFNFYNFLTTKYASQVSNLGTSFQGCISNVNGNLVWNNGSGIAIQITSGTGINIASVGTIGGDYGQPGITASVVYTDIIKTFVFTQASGISAKMAVGDVSITDTSSGAQAVTLKANVSTAAYNFIFPTALPGSTLPLSMGTSGQAIFSQLTATQLIQAVQDALSPTGSINAYGGTTAPSGWLVCDGSSLLQASFPALFAIIGTSYGSADGTHFNIPDLRGYFARGWDNGAGHDPDSTTRTALNTGGNTGDNIGSYQADQNLSHTHNGTGNSVVINNAGTNNFTFAPGINQAVNMPFDGGNQANPRNVYVNYIIKT